MNYDRCIISVITKITVIVISESLLGVKEMLLLVEDMKDVNSACLFSSEDGSGEVVPNPGHLL